MHRLMNKKGLAAVRDAKRLIEAVRKSSDLWDQNCARARSLLEEALVADTNDILLLTCLGAVLSDQGRHRDATEVLRKSAANGSKDRNTYFNLGVAVLNSGAHEEAMRWFKMADELHEDPESWQAYFDPQAH
jgi:Tfp pilus assembly protein PilF